MGESLTAKVRRMSYPVDRTAASVIGGGVHYEEERLDFKAEIVSDEPFAMRPYPWNAPAEFDLTGKIIGRFQVLGLSTSRGGSWVVRCSCGSFCRRSRKSLLAEDAVTLGQKMCPRCMAKIAKNRKRSSLGEIKNGLKAASLPMYGALLAILKEGLTQENREKAEKAIAIALGADRRNDAVPNAGELLESLRRSEDRTG